MKKRETKQQTYIQYTQRNKAFLALRIGFQHRLLFLQTGEHLEHTLLLLKAAAHEGLLVLAVQ